MARKGAKELDVTYLAQGIQLGLACAAGVCQAAEGMSNVQCAAMLDALASQPASLGSITKQAIEDAVAGRTDPAKFRELMAQLTWRARHHG